MSDNLVIISTSMGEIKVELWPEATPKTVENFLAYVDKGFFNGTIFHRVIDGFMVQGGGFNADMRQKGAGNTIRNEAGEPNKRGTLAMARTPDPHSATAQFFINLVDNAFLDFKSETAQGWGYCVFGKVVEGMDVVDKMAKVPTGSNPPHQNVPVTPIVINSVSLAQ
jgi:peptidyl-prolyl cis-trans isomerase B (cyclophilin B)